MNVDKLRVWLFSFAILFIGLAFLLVLPPFEGFDEIGHYSSIRQIADTGTIPLAGQSFVPQEVEQYGNIGPMHKTVSIPWVANPEKNLSYADFFSKRDLQEIFQEKYRSPVERQIFTPSDEQNWQSQHPPLYYILMAPLAKLADSLSFVTQFFVLRLASFLIACVGLFMGFHGTARMVGKGKQKLLSNMFLLYPFIVPMFFTEFARLGNDSLCLFIVGALSLALARWLDDEFSTSANFAVGFCFALGFVTKAFFLPIFIGFLCFYFLRLWEGRSDKKLTSARWDHFFIMICPTIFAGFWFIYNLHVSGNPIGHADYNVVAKNGGLIAMLHDNINLKILYKAILWLVFSWQWPMTASGDVFQYRWFLPVLFLGLTLLVVYIARLLKFNLTHPIWLPFWLVIFFILGLFHHIFYGIALLHRGNTPGWYLSILSPFIALAFAEGADVFIKRRLWRALFFWTCVLFFPFFAGSKMAASNAICRMFSFER